MKCDTQHNVECWYAECRSAKCLYAECRGAILNIIFGTFKDFKIFNIIYKKFQKNCNCQKFNGQFVKRLLQSFCRKITILSNSFNCKNSFTHFYSFLPRL